MFLRPEGAYSARNGPSAIVQIDLLEKAECPIDWPQAVTDTFIPEDETETAVDRIHRFK
jgi:hypothetical protein